MHIVERIHLAEPGILHDDLEITAPHVLTPHVEDTSRILYRQRARKYDIVEGVCALQGNYSGRPQMLMGMRRFVPATQTEGGKRSASREVDG